MALALRHFQSPHPFIAFSSLATAVSFWYGGTAAGLFAMFLSCLAMSRFFVPLRPFGPASESYFIIYGIFSASVGWFSISRRRVERLLIESRENLELRVTERTSELTSVNHELQRAQVELHTEKDRLKLLLDLTNNLVSDLEIREAVRSAISSARQITQSDFIGVSLPNSDDDVQAARSFMRTRARAVVRPLASCPTATIFNR